MTANNTIVSVILAGHDCGIGYSADDLAMLSVLFSMAAQTVREGGKGRICCSEPGADSQGKLLAEIRVSTPASRVTARQHPLRSAWTLWITRSHRTMEAAHDGQ